MEYHIPHETAFRRQEGDSKNRAIDKWYEVCAKWQTQNDLNILQKRGKEWEVKVAKQIKS